MTRLGGYTLHAVDTGYFRLDGGAMFGIIPRPLWERRIEPDDRNRIRLGMRCLLLEGQGRLALVDAGLGHKYDDKFADIYGVDHDRATLDGSLQALGFSKADVTDLILTHLHFDHCGGATFRDGDRVRVSFPNATIHVQQRHWAWALKPNARERGSFLRENLAPLQESGQLQLLEGSGEVLPNVFTHVVNGHTEAQQLVRVAGEGRSLLYTADLMPTHAHLPEVWNMAYDVRPLVTMEEKAALLQEAHAGNWSLFFEHDAAVEVADLALTGKGFEAVSKRTLKEL